MKKAVTFDVILEQIKKIAFEAVPPNPLTPRIVQYVQDVQRHLFIAPDPAPPVAMFGPDVAVLIAELRDGWVSHEKTEKAADALARLSQERDEWRLSSDAWHAEQQAMHRRAQAAEAKLGASKARLQVLGAALRDVADRVREKAGEDDILEVIDVALASAPTAEARPQEVGERWYLGTMNDGLFIIDRSPRPSTDEQWHDRPDGPKLVLNVTGLSQEAAQRIVDAYNATSAAIEMAKDRMKEREIQPLRDDFKAARNRATYYREQWEACSRLVTAAERAAAIKHEATITRLREALQAARIELLKSTQFHLTREDGLKARIDAALATDMKDKTVL